MRCPILRGNKSIAIENHTHRKIIRTENHTHRKSYAQKSLTHKLEAQRYNKDEIIHIEQLHAQNNPAVIMI